MPGIEECRFSLNGKRETEEREHELLLHSGMLQKRRGLLTGWAWIPQSGLQMVFTLLLSGRQIFLQVHGERLFRGKALLQCFYLFDEKHDEALEPLTAC